MHIECACAYVYRRRSGPCGEISRVAFIRMCWLKHAATFRGQQDFEVRRDFEEIRYFVVVLCPATVVHGYFAVCVKF